MTNRERPASNTLPDLYDGYYFAHGCGMPYEHNEHWHAHFGAIADRIVADIHPRTVLDAGCAMGFLVAALRDRGVEAYGIDVSEYALENVRADIRPYCARQSILEPFRQKYDLITCIEILEHLGPRDGQQAIANLCDHTDDVLFSSTPFDFREATHINVQLPEYWAGLFAERGFWRDVDFDASCITYWAAHFRRSDTSLPHCVRNYERKVWPLWVENAELRGVRIEMRNQLAQQDHAIRELQAQNHEQGARIQDLEATVRQHAAEVARISAEAARVSDRWQAVTHSKTWKMVRHIERLRLMLTPWRSVRK